MQSARAQNQAALRDYNYRLKVRERTWMQRRSTYGTKKVQFEQEVDQANIAAQRAYSRTQQQLNNARSLAILENQEDFKKMLASEGAIEVSAAERGVRGRAVARQLVSNKANFGISQALRSRGLIQAGYMAKQSNEDVNRQLKSMLNQSFGKVALQPIQDIAPPKPVLQSPGMSFMLGMGEALGAGIAGNPDFFKPKTPIVTPDVITPTSTVNYGNTFPSGSFGYGTPATRLGLANNRNLYL